RAPHEPAFTVGSLATTRAGRPSTSSEPVTTPSAGRFPAAALASSPSSTNEPSSPSSRIRSRTGSFFTRPSLDREPEAAADHQALHLGGTLADLQDLRVPVEPGHRELLHETVAAQHLDGG